MNRDFEKYPDDENGNVLWRMAEGGDNLDKAREVDFATVFPDEEAALKFAIYLLRNDQKVSLTRFEENTEMQWQVFAHPRMVPSHDNISKYEALMGDTAARLGGRNDGWGCFGQD